jgi:hypothetical protein
LTAHTPADLAGLATALMDALDADAAKASADDATAWPGVVARRESLLAALGEACSALLAHQASGGVTAADARQYAPLVAARLAVTIERSSTLGARAGMARDSVASALGRLDLAERASQVYASVEAARQQPGRSSLTGRARS